MDRRTAFSDEDMCGRQPMPGWLDVEDLGRVYGLSRDQYEHVLSTFSHASYAKAPELCLAKFDELKRLGLDAFTRKHDPYHDIPLNENLAQPVIDLPIPEEAKKEDQGRLF